MGRCLVEAVIALKSLFSLVFYYFPCQRRFNFALTNWAGGDLALWRI